jgi:hypothetical protein
MKFRTAKATHRSYRNDEIQDDEINIQLIRQLMSDCMRFYHMVLPQLDMLAAHHRIPLDDCTISQGEDMASLRSESAQLRRRDRVDNELRDNLRYTNDYAHNQSVAENQGLQRRFDHQNRQLDD